MNNSNLKFEILQSYTIFSCYRISQKVVSLKAESTADTCFLKCIYIDVDIDVDSAQSLKSYVKDTTDFINKINTLGELPEESYLVTMDVKALYTNIPNKEGLQALKEAFDKEQHKSIATTVIVTLMTLILTLNNFVLNEKNYLQIKGRYVHPHLRIFSCSSLKKHSFILIYRICLYFTLGTSTTCSSFGQELNNSSRTSFQTLMTSIHPSIKFSHKISKKSIDFLDTIVYIKNRRLHTTIFTKPTDKQNYLHYKSEHPLPLKNSILFGQILRIKRICSEAKEFMKNCTKMLSKFTLRGYPKIITQQAYHKTFPLQRNNLLKTKMKKRSQRIPLVVTYNRTLPPLDAIVDKHWYILQSDPKMEDKFNERPVVAYRRCKNLRDMIGSNKISNNKSHQTYQELW